MIHRNFFITTLALSLAAAGFAQSTVTKSFTVNGTTNSCIWHVPGGINKPAVVFFIHGANGSGGGFANDTRADAVADREKFIAVYPSASSSGGAGVWSNMRDTTHFPFFLAILDTLDRRYQIDRNRVYMTGFSQGGFISFVAGCSYSGIFAAIAPVSGHAGSPCTLKRPVPVFLTYGALEDKVAFVNDLAIWLKLDSCPSVPTVTRPYPASNPQSRVTRVSYGPCARGTYVIMDSISGQGHQWPSTTNLNQAEETWTFFKQFSLNGNTAIGRPAIDATRKIVTASYASGTVRLHGVREQCRVKIIDCRGRTIADRTALHRRFSLMNTSGGVYMVVVDDNDRAAMTLVIP